MSETSIFAQTIINQRYSHIKSDGTLETWEDIANRVSKNVLSVVDLPKDTKHEIREIIIKKQFIPAGRYLFAAGRQFKQISNCLSLRAEDSREGWADLLRKASMALMTGAGIGVNYSSVREEGRPILKTGGTSSGPLSLMKMLNEVGREVKQGGTRRSACLSILSWKHPDIYKYIEAKEWKDNIKEAKAKDFNFPAPLDGTNISVQLDDDFFTAFHNAYNRLHSHANSVYWAVIENMLKTGEPGFTVDIGINKHDNLRNAPICADTNVLLSTGYTKVKDIIDKPVIIWTGVRWAKNVVFKKTKINADLVKVSLSNGNYIKCDQDHEFLVWLNSSCVNWRMYPDKDKFSLFLHNVKAKDLEIGNVCHVVFPKSDNTISFCLSVNVTKIEVLKEKEDVYCCDVGYEEHSFMAEGILISNCSEFTTDNDSESCNLGSINLARIESLDEMKKVVELGTIFLLAGSIYGDVPYPEVKPVIEKNRRIGLGLMGLHEWLLLRNKRYDIDEDLGKYLEIYSTSTEIAHKYCEKFEINKSIKTRAIAPSGTISLVAETTSGIEPLFCVAYKRRYRKGHDLIEYQYVLDPTAKRLVDKGINPDIIEDAYMLSENVERRVNFQTWIQSYTDMGLSSTINLPAFGTIQNNNNTIRPFGNMLIKYLPKLRGITTYPDGARGAQPMIPVKWHTAIKHVGQVFVESSDVCSIKGGSCNS